MQFSLLKTRRRANEFAVIVPALTILFLVSGVFQWSPLSCWHEDVDLSSGRVRRTRYLLYCRVGERIEDTWASRALDDRNAPPDWRRVNTFSPGVGHSPHYRYHSAIHQIGMLERIDGAIAFEPAARRKVTETLLALWRENGSTHEADEYIDRVAEIAFSREDRGESSIRKSDLPAGRRDEDVRPTEPVISIWADE